VPKPLGDDGGEQVLSGVLLHVVEPAAPVDPAAEPFADHRRGHHVRDALAFVHHVHDIHFAEPAGIEGLPAGGGIECGALEVDPPAVVRAIHHGRVEVDQISIAVVEALGHAFSVTRGFQVS
jgi:hypothetical protein